MCIRDRYHIGKLADLTGCSADAIRYYEKEGVIPEPVRSSGGQRLYSDQDAKRLQIIQYCRDLGFSLQEIREIMEYLRSPEQYTSEVRGLVERHLSEIQSQLRRYQRAQGTLAKCLDKSDERITHDLQKHRDNGGLGQ